MSDNSTKPSSRHNNSKQVGCEVAITFTPVLPQFGFPGGRCFRTILTLGTMPIVRPCRLCFGWDVRQLADLVDDFVLVVVVLCYFDCAFPHTDRASRDSSLEDLEVVHVFCGFLAIPLRERIHVRLLLSV